VIAHVTLLPSARRLMDSLREIGYDLPSAVADVVDNSLTANATRVDLTFAFDGADSWIRIADDGDGMTGAVLDEAMRYGTERTYGASDLGRFGLGLKTASLSQCRCLTVASRRGVERCRIEIRRWDLDHVVRSNRWEVLKLDAGTAPDEITEPLRSGPGTVVLWEGLDRVLEYRLPNGAAARQGIGSLAEEVRAHVAMVFHRFLSREAAGGRGVEITINGEPISAWDPYARAERHTRALPPQVVSLPSGLGAGRLLVRPYLLPTQERFSSAAGHARASGPQRWNRQQGFYFYRNDRLIQAGGWNRLRTIDEHTKLARIAVDLPPGCDEAFRVNVSKMRVSLPRPLRDPLMAIASGVTAQAGSRYREAPRGARTGSSGPASMDLAETPTMVATLAPAERDVVALIVGLARDEFRDDPDIVRRFLSRLERVPAPTSECVFERTTSDAPPSVM
jgi:histidine kinase/DNA gyrase B/HSP90-like ATPase